MCLRPISLYNPKKNLSLYGGIPFKIEVPCGSCAECEKSKQQEWYFRAYYESKYTFDNGGYIYFDTLTYRNEDLPHMSDYLPEIKGRIIDNSCFNTEHYRYFFVNLRRQLEYHGFDVKNKLKYFLCSEYGVDDRYTHRPHYHVLFYILDDSLSPIELSNYVAKCWKFGRTDGAPYKGNKYVLNHTFGKKYNSDEVHMQTVCNYVAKYVTKDNKFQNTIQARLNAVFVHKGEELSMYEQDKMNKLRKEMEQFHRQSHGFGEAFVLYNDMDEVWKTGMISMPDKNNIIKHIPLPGYYTRKLFYELVRDFEGKLVWKKTPAYEKFKLNRKLQSISLMTDKFKDWHENMVNRNVGLVEGYVDEDGHVWSREEVEDWYRDHIDKFDKLLGDRTIQDFVIYLLCYKNRIKSPEEVVREENGIFKVDKLDLFVQREFAIEQEFGYKQVYNYAHYTYKRAFGGRFISDVDLGDKDHGFDSRLVNWFVWKGDFEQINDFTPSLEKTAPKSIKKDFYNKDLFEKKYVINDKSDIRFENFDYMYWLWCDSLRYVNVNKQKYHDWRKDYADRMKQAGVLTKSL